MHRQPPPSRGPRSQFATARPITRPDRQLPSAIRKTLLNAFSRRVNGGGDGGGENDDEESNSRGRIAAADRDWGAGRHPTASGTGEVGRESGWVAAGAYQGVKAFSLQWRFMVGDLW